MFISLGLLGTDIGVGAVTRQDQCTSILQANQRYHHFFCCQTSFGATVYFVVFIDLLLVCDMEQSINKASSPAFLAH